MWLRLVMLGLAGMLAFSPIVKVAISNERGVLFLKAWVDGVGPLLFVFDPGAPDFITAYGRRRLGGNHGFRVLDGDPEQLDPRHNPSNGTIAGTIGAGLLQRYAVRIDYANGTITLIPFPTLDPSPQAQSLALEVDRFGMPTVAAAVDGLSGKFEIDVRAPRSMLFTPFVHAHNFHGEESHAITLGRYVVRDSTVILSRASSGKFASADVAGLIGNDVLSRFVVTLDYQRHRLYVER